MAGQALQYSIFGQISLIFCRNMRFSVKYMRSCHIYEILFHKYIRSGVANMFDVTNICDPVSQIYAIRCRKYMRYYKYMRSCFTNICDPVSQIYVISQIYMGSYFTNICDRCQLTLGAQGPSTREDGLEDKGPPCWFSNGSSQISTSQRLPQNEF